METNKGGELKKRKWKRTIHNNPLPNCVPPFSANRRNVYCIDTQESVSKHTLVNIIKKQTGRKNQIISYRLINTRRKKRLVTIERIIRVWLD